MSNYKTNSILNFSEIFHALGNPNRLRIFLRLAQCCTRPGGCNLEAARSCVGDLGADLEIASSTISHHIKELRQVGLVKMTRRGQYVDCWADPEVIGRVTEFFQNLISEDVCHEK